MKPIHMLALATFVFLPMWAEANDTHCCPDCGCRNVRKVCCLVPDVKKVTTVVLDVECEDFCVPGPSKLCGEKCVPDCNGGHMEKIWKMCCGKVHTRQKLVKRTVVAEKPGYKCVVKVICTGCGCHCGTVAAEDEAGLATVKVANVDEPESPALAAQDE